MQPQRDPFDQIHRFSATLFHSGGKGGWNFAPLPKEFLLPVTGGLRFAEPKPRLSDDGTERVVPERDAEQGNFGACALGKATMTRP